MEFERKPDALVAHDADGKLIAEITFPPTDDPMVVNANHTFVDVSLRGQGVAGQLLDEMVAQMSAEGKKIKATCPYVVDKFNNEPEKYDFINADR
ncbi:GNAT family N-acetyltransferase [Fundicoccus culcitae]|uniref:N-acetyltransferase n=1 Tax=Fundicoccus culcitae TaxID=2969821 RepID=A0ABY5P2U0_9LACT|nr:GNAT family N-acetyltransferase [Fundicoccus culcitae]UUX32879.1 N-acetyltransferase [Fundicoccus culcitae]